ncbi:hypothetical protein [Paenibacillus wenxiniae]|uniref:DUF4231 domain-containing protein n=1 Tax=Paenibacillus wenxiniae TaxID=1636843 RepID=A0ABW4RFY1_9BACL
MNLPSKKFMKIENDIMGLLFKKLSYSKVLLNSSAYWLLGFMLFVIITVLVVLGISLQLPTHSKLQLILGIVGIAGEILVAISLLKWLPNIIKKHIKLKYVAYNYEQDFGSSQDKFLFGYRMDTLLNDLSTYSIDSSNIDNWIEHFENKSERLKLSLWKPILITTAILFPMWNEFIAINMSKGWGVRLLLFIIAIILAMVCVYINILLERTLLSKANKYSQVADILKAIKQELNNTI